MKDEDNEIWRDERAVSLAECFLVGSSLRRPRRLQSRQMVRIYNENKKEKRTKATQSRVRGI
jgi:hypothetical protein